MAIYTLRVDNKFWREVKAECAHRGVTIKALILDRLGIWVKESQKLRRKERKVGL